MKPFASCPLRPGFCLALVLSLGSVGVEAQPTNIPREDFWAVNYDVHALVVTNGLAYVGGRFSTLSSGYAVVDAQFNVLSGELEAEFSHANGYVYSVVPDGAGGWFIGGNFTMVGGLPRAKLAHLLADRSVDPNWHPDPDGAVERLALFDNTLYVGGTFSSIAGQSRGKLASFDIRSGGLQAWNPNATNRVNGSSDIVALLVTKETVYVGGLFDFIGGAERRNLAAVDRMTGLALNWRPDPDDVVVAMALSGDTIFTGGKFTQMGGQPRSRLAALDRTTGQTKTWNPGSDDQIRNLYVVCDTVYAAGWFTQIGGQPRRGVAGLDARTGQATGWNPQANGYVESLAFAGNTVFAGGTFTEIGGQPRRWLAALDFESGHATEWLPRAVWPSVVDLAVSGRTLYVGGGLGGENTYRMALAAFDVATGRPTAWNPDVDDSVTALAITGNTVYVGGAFTHIDGQPRQYIAAIDATTGRATAWNPGANSNVLALAVSGNIVYAAGAFTRIGGQPRNYLAALDATTGLATSWNPAPDGVVISLLPVGQVVFVGGAFTRVGGLSVANLAKLDAPTGLAYYWGPWPNATVYALALVGSVLYVGGDFTSIGGWPQSGVAAVDGINGPVYPWQWGANGRVWALSVSGNVLYAGGEFTQIGGASRKRLAALNYVTGEALAWKADLVEDFEYVRALATTPDTLYVGGPFLEIAGVARPDFAVFPPTGSPVVTLQPKPQTLAPGQTITLNVAASGVPPLSYQWQRNGTNLPGSTATNFVIAQAQVQDSGSYGVVVTGGRGQASSASATVTVVQAPALLTQPVGQTVAPTANVTLAVTASGNPPPLYHWRRNGVDVPGAVNSTLVLTNVQPTDGGKYNVIVANAGGAVSSAVAELVVTGPALPFADNLAARGLASSLTGLGSGNNSNATAEAGEPAHAGKAGGKSLWLGWVATTNGVAKFSTRGSGFDTLLALYTNSVPASPPDVAHLGLVIADDDHGGFLGSEVVFNAVAGTEYLIAIDGFGQASGNTVLSWSVDPNIAEVSRIFQQPVSQTVAPGTDVSFSIFAASGLPLYYQWVFNCAVIPGATNAVLTVINVQPANVGSYAVLVSNSPDSLQGGSAGQCSGCLASVRAFLEIGPDSKVLSQDKLGDVTAALNRSSTQNTPLRRLSSIGFVSPGVLGTQVLNNFGATTEQGEPNHAGVIGGASRWRALAPDADGLLQVDTIGSKVDTVLAVYTGTGLLDLQLVAEDNNSGPDGFSSLVRFPAKRGTNYLVAVDAANAAQGEIHLNWQLDSPPVISQAPTNHAVSLGGTITLLVGTTGSPIPSLQWRWNGVPLAGQTNATLTLTNFQAAQAGIYSVIASNYLGTLTNEVATLAVAELLRLHSAAFLANGTFRFLLSGNLSPNTVVQASSNLLNWLPIFTNPVSTAPIEVIDSGTSNRPFRFYRAVQ